MASPDPADQDVIDALDSFYCHNVVAALWLDALANRLEGLAIYLLSDELQEVAEYARAAARRLADRIGDLGGGSDPRAITGYALQRLDVIVAAYQTFLDKVSGRDDVSFALVVDLLGAETHRRADVKAALAGQGAAR
jgi:ferritin-like protein